MEGQFGDYLEAKMKLRRSNLNPSRLKFCIVWTNTDVDSLKGYLKGYYIQDTFIAQYTSLYIVLTCNNVFIVFYLVILSWIPTSIFWLCFATKVLMPFKRSSKSLKNGIVIRSSPQDPRKQQHK